MGGVLFELSAVGLLGLFSGQAGPQLALALFELRVERAQALTQGIALDLRGGPGDTFALEPPPQAGVNAGAGRGRGRVLAIVATQKLQDDAPHHSDLSRDEAGLFAALAAEEDPVGAVEVLDPHLTAVDEHAGVMAGHERIVTADRALRGPTDEHGLGTDLELPVYSINIAVVDYCHGQRETYHGLAILAVPGCLQRSP